MSREKQIDTPTNTPTQNQFTNSELKQIEEMARKNCHFEYHIKNYKTCKECYEDNYRACRVYEVCRNLYNADYRKQSESIDEFVELLKKEMNNLSRMEYHCDPYFLVSKDFVDRIAAKMKGGEE